MNQGIGRAVRHKFDYGSIIIIESRIHDKASKAYNSGRVQKYLSEMITKNWPMVKNIS